MALTSEYGRVRARAVDHLAVAVGTTRGLFIVSDGHIDGPIFPGEQVTSFAGRGEPVPRDH